MLIVGDFTEDRLAASYRRAFIAIGQHVDGFDLARAPALLAWPARNRILRRLTSSSLNARRRWSRCLNALILEAARKSPSHWVLLVSGEWVMAETIQSMKQIGKQVAIFHTDNPFPPHYNNRPETLPAAREADLYLIWSERLVRTLQAAGVKRAVFTPFGWDPVACPFQGHIRQGTWPGVLFVGGWDREREEFLDEVAAHVPLRIHGPAYWGNRTKANSRARRSWVGSALTLPAAARAFREAAISLNILRTQHVIEGTPDGTIMRHFEVPGAGGFLLSTRGAGATRLFPDGHTAAYFADIHDCVHQCKNYLTDEAERCKLAERSHAEVASRHTYAHRAREMTALMLSIEATGGS